MQGLSGGEFPEMFFRSHCSLRLYTAIIVIAHPTKYRTTNAKVVCCFINYLTNFYFVQIPFIEKFEKAEKTSVFSPTKENTPVSVCVYGTSSPLKTTCV